MKPPHPTPCAEAERCPMFLWETPISAARHLSHVFRSSSLCSWVDEENKNISQGGGSRKKVEEEVISKKQKAEVIWRKKMGTGLCSGTARFLTGSLPSAPWEVRSSALQTHEGHHLLQLEGQPLFPGCVILLQCTHNLSVNTHTQHDHWNVF